MAKIHYIEHSGVEHVVDVKPGYSVMYGAVSSGLSGIAGDCGGNCNCGTCHVYVDAAWLAAVGDPGTIERSLLDVIRDRAQLTEVSRLSCQIEVSSVLDGLVVRMPESQV